MIAASSIRVRDRAAAAAEDFDVTPATFAQKIDNLCEKFDVTTIVARDTDRAHIFLDRGTDDIADRPMVAEINDFDSVANELKIDCVDGAVVSVTNWDSGQDSNRRSHFRFL